MKKQKEMKAKPNKKEAFDILSALLFIPAGIFIGLALGILFDKITIAILLGIGFGFLFAAISKILKR